MNVRMGFFSTISRLNNKELFQIAGAVSGIFLSAYFMATYGYITDFIPKDNENEAPIALKIASSVVTSMITAGISSWGFGKVGEAIDFCTKDRSLPCVAYESITGNDAKEEVGKSINYATFSPGGSVREFSSAMREVTQAKRYISSFFTIDMDDQDVTDTEADTEDEVPGLVQ